MPRRLAGGSGPFRDLSKKSTRGVHPRRSITERVQEELARVRNVLNSGRTDASLPYATTAVKLLNLRRSNAMDDHAQVVEKLVVLLA